MLQKSENSKLSEMLMWSSGQARIAPPRRGEAAAAQDGGGHQGAAGDDAQQAPVRDPQRALVEMELALPIIGWDGASDTNHLLRRR